MDAAEKTLRFWREVYGEPGRCVEIHEKLGQLVVWAESALMEGEFDEHDTETLSSVVARLGVADVRAFCPAREDCDELPHRLGCASRVEVVAA